MITITPTITVHWPSKSYAIRVQSTDTFSYSIHPTLEVTPIYLRSGTSTARRPMIRRLSNTIPFKQHDASWHLQYIFPWCRITGWPFVNTSQYTSFPSPDTVLLSIDPRLLPSSVLAPVSDETLLLHRSLSLRLLLSVLHLLPTSKLKWHPSSVAFQLRLSWRMLRPCKYNTC